MTAPVAPMEALKRLRDIVMQLDAAECPALYNQIQGELAVADTILRQAAPVAQPAQKVKVVWQVPYGWVNSGIDRVLKVYATLNIGAENPWQESANAFPVYTTPELVAQQVEAVEQDDKSAFEAWAKGEYDLRPYNWKVISVGGVPYDGYVRPYKTDRTVYAFEGFIAGRKCAAPQLEAQQAKTWVCAYCGGRSGEACNAAGCFANEASEPSAQQAGDVALKEAVAKFIQAKGRFHTEQNYAALVAAYDAIA